jgi:hypothetical protein
LIDAPAMYRFDGVGPVSNDQPSGGTPALKLPDQPAVMVM